MAGETNQGGTHRRRRLEGPDGWIQADPSTASFRITSILATPGPVAP